VPRMCNCMPSRKVMTTAVAAGTSVLLLDLTGTDLRAELTAIVVALTALAVGYAVPPAPSDRLDSAPPGPRARQITGTIIAS
jgi:hypothetical protein